LNETDLKDADFTNSNWWRARGLTTAQLEVLKKEFVPTEDAPVTLKEDYREWLDRNGTTLK
jgi:hypothetical protein